ncbi:MAG: hypothetical protein J1E39_04560 [Eubacterium sp.]|nr:hypothetical protein [Eubacterium sp.]
MGALIFLGYSVAPAVINFFNERAESSSQESEPVWTPPVSVDSESSDSSQPPETDEPVESTPDEVQEVTLVAPLIALDSAQALKNYLDSVKDSCTTVVFTLKNEDGELLYKSTVKTAQEDYALIGKLTLQQIVSACNEAGVKPAAAFNTLLDRTTPHLISKSSYRATEGWMWLDNSIDRGGKPWTSPLVSETGEYFAELTAEIAGAGFEVILLQNTMYPNFRAYDYNLLPSNVRAADRSDRLAEVLAACAAGAKGAQSYAEIDAADLLAASVTDYDGTAEVWQSIGKAAGCKVIINIDTALFGTSVTAGKNEIKVNKNPQSAIPQLIGEIKKITGSTEIGIRISGNISDADLMQSIVQGVGIDTVMVG